MLPRPNARVMALGMAVVVSGIVVAADLGLPLPLRRLLAAPLADKLGHFVLFGGLSWLVVQAAIEVTPRPLYTRVGALCSLALVAIAAIEEFSQRYIRSRTFDLWDLFASAFGIIVMAMLQVSRQRTGELHAPTGAKGRRV